MREDSYNGVIYWEANVVPEKAISRFRINGEVEMSIASPIAPEAGQMHKVELEAGGDLQPGTYTTLKGNYNRTLTIKDGNNMTVVLDEAHFDVKDGPAIDVWEGNPTIIVKGTNTIRTTGQSPAIQLGGWRSNITLEGQETGTLDITVAGNENTIENATIGGTKDNHGDAGAITICDLALSVDFGSGKTIKGAVIGSGPAYNWPTSCGAITLTNTTLSITGTGCTWQGVIIGTGTCSYGNSCGDITITLPSGQTREEFLASLPEDTHQEADYTPAQKVGAGGYWYESIPYIGTITWMDANGDVIP